MIQWNKYDDSNKSDGNHNVKKPPNYDLLSSFLCQDDSTCLQSESDIEVLSDNDLSFDEEFELTSDCDSSSEEKEQKTTFKAKEKNTVKRARCK